MWRFSFVTALLIVGLTGCNKSQNQSVGTQPADVTNADPANGNLASADQSGAQPASVPAAPEASYEENSSYQQPVQASEPPPPLPDYSQPPAPGDDYVWTPGYWDYASSRLLLGSRRVDRGTLRRCALDSPVVGLR